MPLQLQFITDAAGNKTAVVISYKEWMGFERKYQKLLTKLEVLDTIRKGIKEVKKARQSGADLQTLEDFLNEN
jgi:hypothetical protein